MDWSLSSVPVDTNERRALLTRDLPIARPHHHAANGLPDGVPARRIPSREFRIGRFSIGSDGKYGLRTAAKKVEGGSGGKRGHSNVTRWEYTEEIKQRSRQARRGAAKALERDAKQTRQ